MTFVFGSLFAGIGGFDLGFEQAGMKCAWQSEIDQFCLRVLDDHWPTVPQLGDVRNVGRANAEPVDLICGGFPCQDVSIAGQRKGLVGDESGLWFEFHRILAELTPRWVVIENVPGLLSSNRGRDFATILSGLEEIGYMGAWRTLDAQYFGVAQRRRRVFIVGYLGEGRGPEILFEPESGAWDSPPSKEAGTQVAGAFTPGARGTRIDARLEMVIPFCNQVTNENNRSNPDADSPCHALMGDTHPPMVAGTLSRGYGRGAEIGDHHVVVPFCNQMVWSNRRIPQPGSPSHPLMGDTHPPMIASTVRTRMDSGLNVGENIVVTPTLSGGYSKGSWHPEPGEHLVVQTGARRMTPTECERLQGFPDGWTGGNSDTARYIMLGNAVVVPVAQWLGRRILEAENGRSSTSSI